MAQAKYFRVTPQIMMSYETNQYDIVNDIVPSSQEVPSHYYIYTGLDQNLYYTHETILSNIKFGDESDSEYTYLGNDIKDTDVFTTRKVDSVGYYNYNSYTKREVSQSEETRTKWHYDTIKVYFICGYVLDGLAGITLQVQAPIDTTKYYDGLKHSVSTNNQTYTETEYLTLVDYFLPKEMFTEQLHLMTHPIYMNSKYYDKYIEIKVLSPYAIALNSILNIQDDSPLNDDGYFEFDDATQTQGEELIHYVYNVNKNSNVLVKIATVGETNITSPSVDSKNYASTFVLDPIVDIAIGQESNSDYFNIRMYLDEKDNSIVYYPVYGKGNTAIDLNLAVMNNIESGAIPMITDGYYDSDKGGVLLNEGIDQFIELYGEDARKWIVYNDFEVEYVYSPYAEAMIADERQTRTYKETFTYAIDYTDKTDADGDFWRNKFIPNIKQRNNMYCSAIHFVYTCRLCNRVNGSEAIRTASMTIDTNINRFNRAKIDTRNIITYKVINQIVDNKIIQNAQQEQGNTKYIRSYYDATTLVAKDGYNGNAYSQGEMVLKLKRTSTNYMIKLFTLNDDNVRIPYDMTGPYQYKLVFPSSDGDNISIYPNSDSEDMNLGVGCLVFYITADQALRIMNVPYSERYFALTTDEDESDAQKSTLYEGKVEWY